MRNRATRPHLSLPIDIIKQLQNTLEKVRVPGIVPNRHQGQEQQVSFPKFFKHIWDTEGAICYSPYGSFVVLAPNRLEQQIQIKNSPNFYQQAPFLTIAKELLMLIKAGKVERLIFLSAYDKR